MLRRILAPWSEATTYEPPVLAFPWARVAARNREAALVVSAIMAATLLALVLRLRHSLAADFPLNDGGLFAVMVRDMQAAGWLPELTSYNGGIIPFAYPPLAFWLGAAFAWAGIDPVELFRFLPAVVSALTVPAFFLLARRILPTAFAAVVATFAFALLPRSFSWEIVGGGLPRALGFLLALLALHQAYAMYQEADRRRAVAAGLLGGLVVLTHPQMAAFAAGSLALFFVFTRPSRASLAGTFVVCAIAAAVSSPWWVTVLARHGAEPLLSAAQTGGHEWGLVRFRSLLWLQFTEEPHAPLFAVLGVTGTLFCVARRQFLLPVWLVAVFLFDPRKAHTVAMVPLAMLLAVTVVQGILPALAGRQPDRLLFADWRERPAAGVLPAAALGGLLLWGCVASLHAPSVAGSPLHAIEPQDREAMAWVEEHTPAGARFIVVRGPYPSFIDGVSEWFPALTGRQSVATVQGYEWLGKARYDEQQAGYAALQGCAGAGVDCIEDWAEATGRSFTHVYLMKSHAIFPEGASCCERLELSLIVSPRYELVYNGPGATIFAVRRP